MTNRERWRDQAFRDDEDEQREAQEYGNAPSRRLRQEYGHQYGGVQGRGRSRQFGQENYQSDWGQQGEMPQSPSRRLHSAGEYLGGNPDGGTWNQTGAWREDTPRRRFWDSDRERAGWRGYDFDDNALGPRVGHDARYSSMREYGYGPSQQEERGFLDRAGDEIASWFGDEDARRRREQDFRGKGPRGYQRSDDRIREDVNDGLSYDSAVDASDIEVKVANCEVTLSGTVSDRYQKRRAEDCAERVLGVTHVQNNLRVKEQGSADKSGLK